MRSGQPRRRHGGPRAATVLAALLCGGHAAIVWRILPNWWRVPELSRWHPVKPGRALPRLSIIVPARDEATTLRPAVASLLRQDYPDYEVILIDDRSTDATRAIMAEIAATHPGRVQLIAVDALPPGWLGKNHALWLGARRARGDWLLFTDADIVLDPGCCRRAVAYALAERADHLTLAPRIVADGYWLGAFLTFFVYVFLAIKEPHRAADPRSATAVGIGAFNLIRREAYAAVGTHAAIALRPDDDVRLGERVKRLGLRQRILRASDLVAVALYPSVGGAIRGLEKSLFVAADYSAARTAASLAGIGLLMIAPYAWLVRARGATRRLLAGAVALHGLGFLLANAYDQPRALAYIPALPLTCALFCYAVARAAWLATTRGEIRWRETAYPLAILRGQTGLEGLPRRARD
ncbi:MAG TPA: glycosyltransferase [Thermomicrobiales bacterium]|nr:glycosyltransferase [Thermomicrobiales bacterium]